MILNAYAILSVFVALLEAALGATLVVLCVHAARRARGGAARTDDASRSGLLLVAFGLVLASAGSWGLLYLLLDSYVPQWPGVMCIQGVTRIGTGAEGPARALPTLVTALELVKPALLVLGGIALLVHLVDRATPSAPLSRRLVVLLAVLGSLALVDAGVEGAYLAVPKRERTLDRGCCTVEALQLDPYGTGDPTPARPSTVYGFFAATGAAVVLLHLDGLSRGGRSRRLASIALMGATFASVLLGGRFVAELAAPRLLPETVHPCGYCVLGGSAVGSLGIVLHLLGSVTAAWTGGLGLAVHGRVTGPVVARPARPLRIVGTTLLLLSLAGATAVSFLPARPSATSPRSPR